MNRTAAIFCLLIAAAVALGAFGQHGLKAVLTATQLGTLDTAVTYLTVQPIAGLVALRYGLVRPARLLLVGVVLFTGALLAYLGTGWVAVTFAAPVGGLLMILAWLWSAWALWRRV